MRLACAMQRQIGFWLVTLVVAVLLRCSSCAASCCLSSPAWRSPICSIPLADRLQRIGLGRLGATLLILVLFVARLHPRRWCSLVPLRRRSSSPASSTGCPTIVTRLQKLARRAGRPDRSSGSAGRTRFADMQRSIGNLVGQGDGLDRHLPASRCGRAGRRCSASSSLLVVTPVVAFYLLVDWDRMVATVDGWVPRAPSRDRPRHRPRHRHARSPASCAARRSSASSSASSTPSA